MESLIFLVEKWDGIIKARTCANGSTQRVYYNKEDSASPTASIESIFITSIIEAAECRDIAIVDIPNAFIQTNVGKDKDGDNIIMKVRGPLVDMLVELDPVLYKDMVEIEKGKKVLYLVVKKAIYGMPQSALLFYKKLRGDLEEQGFKVNPYDPCTANKMINGAQCTVVWHVDDLKVSHKDPKVIDKFVKWVSHKYGDKEIGEVKAKRGRVHEYLGMVEEWGHNPLPILRNWSIDLFLQRETISTSDASSEEAHNISNLYFRTGNTDQFYKTEWISDQIIKLLWLLTNPILT